MRLAFIILIILVFAKANAQINYFSVNFQMSLPQGNYKETYPKTATGFLFGFAHHLQHTSSVGFGGELGFMQVNNANETYDGYYHNRYNTYSIGATGYIISAAPKLSIDLLTLKHSINIFLDCSIGTNIFLTYSAITHDGGYDILTNSYVLKTDSSSTHSYWALRTGGGLGADITIGKKKKVVAELKCSYLYGSNAKYFSHPSIENREVNLILKESKTSMLLAEAGFRFKVFNRRRK